MEDQSIISGFRSRREVLKIMSVFLSMAPLYAYGGQTNSLGTPLAYNEKRHKQRGLETLELFIDTVIPGAGELPNCTAVFEDSFYRFKNYRKLFVLILNHNSRKLYGRNFDFLDQDERESIVRMMLDKGNWVAKLTYGAIYITQVYIYTGSFGSFGCPLIGFAGGFQFENRKHPHFENLFTESLSLDGNPD
jgi:hypothetical protein